MNKEYGSCSGLTGITIGNSVTNIGDLAFYKCSNLKTIINFSNLRISRGSSNNGYVAYYADRVIYADDQVGEFYFRTENGVHYLSGFNGSDSRIILPDNYEGRSYKIGEKAFYNCSRLTNISIPNSVTEIGRDAFSGSLTNLTNLTIENWLTDMEGMFSSCTNLTHVSVDCMEGGLNLSEFAGSSLRSLTIGSNIRTITGELSAAPVKTIWLTNTPPTGYSAAAGQMNFVSNGNYNLSNTKEYAYLSSIFEAEGVGYIPLNPAERTCAMINLYDYHNTTELDMQKTVNYRGIEMTVDEIAPYTFYNNKNLTKLNLNISGNIGDWAFKGCSSLKNVTIGNEVKSIGDWAFSECSGLEQLSFGSGMESIGQVAFSDCANMTQLISGATVPPTCGAQALEDINKWNCTLKVPKGYTSAYQTADQWKDFFFMEEFVSSLKETTINNVVPTHVDVYNLQGVKVKEQIPVESLNNELPRGIYIINGKKVMVK